MRPNVYTAADTVSGAPGMPSSEATTYASGATSVATESDDGVLTVSPSDLPALRGTHGATATNIATAPRLASARSAGSLYVDARLQTETASAAQRQAFNRAGWWQWVSMRVIQHLMGESMWVELDPAKFAMLRLGNGHYAATRTELDALQTRLNADADLRERDRQAIEERLAAILNKLLA